MSVPGRGVQDTFPLLPPPVSLGGEARTHSPFCILLFTWEGRRGHIPPSVFSCLPGRWGEDTLPRLLEQFLQLDRGQGTVLNLDTQKRLDIGQRIHQGRPFSSVSKFVNSYHRREIWPTCQIVATNSSSLIERYLEERLDVHWSTVKKCAVISI